MNKLRWLPNAISILRILLILPILELIVRGNYHAALLLFFIAGFSDGLDGYLAVRFNWQSRLGGLLDPVADKLLVAGMFITLAWIGLIPVWLASVVIARDVIIVGGALAYNFLVGPVPGEAGVGDLARFPCFLDRSLCSVRGQGLGEDLVGVYGGQAVVVDVIGL